MTTKSYGSWLQVSANLGILVGLVLVGFQMQQNTALLKTQLIYEETGRYIRNEQLMQGENPATVWAKSIESPEELTLEEQRIMESVLWSSVEEWRSAHKLAKIGLWDDEWRTRIAHEAPFLLANDYGRAWWSGVDSNGSEDEFYEAVDAALAASTPNRTAEYFSEVMTALNQSRASNDSKE